jgi:uncharacterized protein (TIGR02466 family)
MNLTNYTIFPSIVSQIDCNLFKSIKADLISWIYEYQNTHESTHRSNRKGWQSETDFHLDPTFEEFKDYIMFHANSATSMYNLNLTLDNMWININKRGSYNVAHSHPVSLLSGVIWVKTSDNCGNIVFNSPNYFTEHLLISNVDRQVAEQYNYHSNFYFTPTEGSMIIFPSSLQHWVEANESAEDRISIAFNLKLAS